MGDTSKLERALGAVRSACAQMDTPGWRVRKLDQMIQLAADLESASRYSDLTGFHSAVQKLTAVLRRVKETGAFSGPEPIEQIRVQVDTLTEMLDAAGKSRQPPLSPSSPFGRVPPADAGDALTVQRNAFK